ncbi:MAG TPA: prenyltransferase/squalene oxidase repeat-containing protein [Pirellulaceae bacterium]|nr:prenyltransferase/squalene oxidase repeat-containing protein [Pirellulaceae bacterium]
MSPIDRRRFLRWSLAWGAASGAVRPLLAAPSSDHERNAGELIKPAAQAAIDKGLAWLASRQVDDGSFKSSGFGRNAAVVALSGMSFLSGGHTPGRGEYGQQVSRCLSYILKCADDSGFISVRDATSHGPMYDHGFATLFLAEVYGMTLDMEVRDTLQAAVKLIVGTQNTEGGWRYQPKAFEADISVTICQIMALRAARNAGIHVPNETIDRCIDYVKRSQNADGGFMYMLSGGPSRFPRSAAGVVALYSAGIYEGEEIRKGLEYLMQHLPKSEDFSRDTHAMYGHYYAVQAMWQAGGDYWKKWYPAIQELLVKQQQKDGSWPDLICAEYGTAMATIILQMPNNYLPIFQR